MNRMTCDSTNFTFLKVLKSITSVLALALFVTVTSCGGGGGTPIDITLPVDITLPATNGTGSVSISNGTATNKYGMAKLWHVTKDIEEIIVSTSTRTSGFILDSYIYFGDDSLVYFLKIQLGTTPEWYGIQFGYTYDSVTKTITLSDGKKWVLSTGVSAQKILDDNYDYMEAANVASFAQTVTMAPETFLDGFDDTYSGPAPVINQLDTTYSPTSVRIDYRITVPAGATINGIGFGMASPSLMSKLNISGRYMAHVNGCWASTGQFFYYHSSAGTWNSSTNTYSGTVNVPMAGTENGNWTIYSIQLSVPSGNGFYIDCETDGIIQANYYYMDQASDSYKDLTFAVKTFNVTGSTPDTTAPAISSIPTFSGSTLTVNTTSEVYSARAVCVNAGFGGQDTGSGMTSVSGTIGAGNTSVTFDFSSAPAGAKYIAAIVLCDNVGNSAIYHGYDPSVSYWTGDFSAFGLDFTKLIRFRGIDKPDVTTYNNLTFN